MSRSSAFGARAAVEEEEQQIIPYRIRYIESQPSSNISTGKHRLQTMKARARYGRAAARAPLLGACGGRRRRTIQIPDMNYIEE